MGELLMKLGQFDKAEQVYSAVLQYIPDAKDQGNIYYQLECIKNNRDDYDEASLFYGKALEIY
jgi:tetratricopeptide (TPR) repeat protein